ncbi:MAG: L,D-transpeptidase family protein [Eubacteriales bacterium]|nr:L,D-transpeptidase family protein [Eubacteriales bacterium]
MSIKKFLSVLCLLFCLVMAGSITVSADTSDTATETKETTGFHKDSKGTYYIKSNGERAYGPYKVKLNGTNYYYYFNQKTGYLATGKIRITSYNGKQYLVDANGIINTTKGLKFVKSTGKVYCVISSSGVLAANKAVTIGSNIYCFSKTGVMYTDGLRTVNGKKYLLKTLTVSGSSGESYKVGVAQTGWQTYNGKKYYFNSKGVMKTGMITSGDNRYYANSKGVLKTGAFRANGKLYYADSDGKLMTGWVQRSDKANKWYYYSKSTGAMVTSKFIKDGSYYYYLGKDGALKTGWYQVNGKWYYGKTSSPNLGARVKSWQTINGKKYYFNTKGVMQTGWLNTKSSGTYYLHSSGYVMTGWQQIDGYWYYFDTSSGQMKTGWLTDNGKTYYLRPSATSVGPVGSMVTGKVSINGKTYTFNSSGALNSVVATGAWSVTVNTKKNIVTIYRGDTAIKAMYCSTGANDATPLGTFKILDKLATHELDGPSWGFYCSHITSDVLFHSIPYTAPNNHYAIQPGAFNLLGQQASHGCIRLAFIDAKWLYNNVPIGTPVTVSQTCATPLTPTYYGTFSGSYDPTDDEI